MKIKITALMLVMTGILRAETIYVSQGGTGNQSGTTAANSKSLAWLNTSENWGAGTSKVSPGDTVSLGGAFTSALTVQGSGSSGSPITFLFAPGANFSAPVWRPQAILISGKSFVTIDGGTDGVIRNTQNGTIGTYREFDTQGITVNGGSNITIKNLAILDIYVHVNGHGDGERNGSGVTLNPFGNNFTIDNCEMTHADSLIGANAPPGTTKNLVISNNDLHDCNHGISLGIPLNQPNTYVEDTQVFGNRFHDFGSWNHSNYHLDHIIIFDEGEIGTTQFRRTKFYNNVFGPGVMGDPPNGWNTAAIFMNGYAPDQFADTLVYNNVFIVEKDAWWSNGCIYGMGYIFNNTFIGETNGGTTMRIGGNGSRVEDNLVINFGMGLSVLANADSAFVANNNVYWGLGGNAFNDDRPGPGYGVYSSLAQWQQYGNDKDSVEAEPKLDDAYVPIATDTVAKDTGHSHAQQFTTDKRGVARPFGPAWDKGAFEYSTSSPPQPTPTPAPTATPTPAPTPTPTPTPAPTATPTPTAPPIVVPPHTHTWNDITGKPANFPSMPHTHPVPAQETGENAGKSGKGKPSEPSGSAHTHPMPQQNSGPNAAAMRGAPEDRPARR